MENETDTTFLDACRAQLHQEVNKEEEAILERFESTMQECRLRTNALFSSLRNKINAVTLNPTPTPQIPSEPQLRSRNILKAKLTLGDFVLKPSSDFGLWKNHINIQLRANDSLFIINDSETSVEVYNETDKQQIKNNVIGYLHSNLDEHYKRIVQEIREPYEIMRTLQNLCKPATIQHEHALRDELRLMRYNPNEDAHAFIARFNDRVNQLRRCPGVTLNDNAEKYDFKNAVKEVYPHVMLVDTVGGGKSPKELKEHFIQHVLFNVKTNPETEGTDKAMLNRPSGRPTRGGGSGTSKLPDNCCKTCGIQGHKTENCKIQSIVCYNCGSHDGHMAYQCQKPLTQKTIDARNRRANRAAQSQRKGQGSNRPRSRSPNRLPSGESKPTGTIPKTNLRPKSKKFKGRREAMPMSEFIKRSKQRVRQGSARLILEQSLEDTESDADALVLVCYPDSDSDPDTAAVADVRIGSDDEDEDSTQGPSKFAAAANFQYDGKYPSKPTISFVADTGATSNMVNDISVLVNVKKLNKTKYISCANKSTSADMTVDYVGDLIIFNEKSKMYSCLKRVLFAPSLVENLFSVRKQISNSVTAVFDDEKIELIDKTKNEVIKVGPYDGHFWWLHFTLPLANRSQEEIRAILLELYKPFDKSCVEESRLACAVIGLGGSSLETGGDMNLGGSIEATTQTDIIETPPRKSPLNGSSSLTSQTLRENLGMLWHLRLNHASLKYLIRLSQTIPEMKGVKFGLDILDCSSCKAAKAKRKPCTKSRTRSDKVFSRLYSDLMGPVKPASVGSMSRYIVTFTDDMSRYVFAYELRDKTQVNNSLSTCLKEIRVLLGTDAKPVELRTDGGLEYKTASMKQLLSENQITHTVSAPYTPQHVGAAERLNLELEEKIRVNLDSSGIPQGYWNYALRHVVHIHNRTPNSANNFASPYELVHKRVPQLNHIRRFGSEAYVLDNPSKPKNKFDNRASRAYLLECNDTCYTLLDCQKRTIIRSKHVDFIESKVYADRQTESANEITFEILDEAISTVNESSTATPVALPEVIQPEQKMIGENEEFEFFEEILNNANDIETDSAEFLDCFLANIENEPSNYKDAVNSPQRHLWIDAINEELKALIKNQTWDILPKSQVPQFNKIVKSRWVNRIKRESAGKIRYRSRLVAKGFADNNEYEISEIYAPVARLADVRFMLCVANKYDLTITQLDIKTAFLNGELLKTVYMEIPEGLTEFLGENEKFRKSHVCQLKRALYGLKVSPKRWFLKFTETVSLINLRPYDFQPCLFKWQENTKLALMLLYVDDILLISNCSNKINEIKSHLRTHFEITDLGEPEKFLGMEIIRDREKQVIYLHQHQHIKAMIEKFNINSTSNYRVPIVENSEKLRLPLLAQAESNPSCSKPNVPYRQAIGLLLYLQNCVRPDITLATNLLSRRQSNFLYEDWEEVMRVMAYLKNNTHLGLKFEGKEDGITCYVDASLGGTRRDGNSTTGYLIKLFGDVIIWRTKRQTHVALSSAEAEYVAMSTACRDVTSLREMCTQLINVDTVPLLCEDSRSAILLAEKEEAPSLRHIVCLTFHYVRSQLQAGNIRIKWIGTDSQLADFFTKALARGKFECFRDQIMCVVPNER